MATEDKPSTKHTPGEWAFGEWDDEDGGGQHFTVDAFINKDAEPELVAIVAGEPDCMEANARLLAAAPDMLEMVRLLMGTVGELPPEWFPDAGAMYAEALELIAKATGGDA